MMDNSIPEIHWEELRTGEESTTHRDDLSFHTVGSVSDHPSEGHGQPKDLTTSEKVTTYDDVTYHSQVGTLILNSHRITFQPHETDTEEDHSQKSAHHSWRWKVIAKHQVSPAKSGKIRMKLISVGDSHKAVMFGFHSREELDRVRKDVSRRLKHAREEPSTTPTKQTHGQPTFDSPAAATLDTTMDSEQEEPKLEVEEDEEAVVATEATALLGAKAADPVVENHWQQTPSFCGEMNQTKVLWAGAATVVAVIVIIFLSHASAGAAAATAARKLRGFSNLE